jgi:hypothetical protein
LAPWLQRRFPGRFQDGQLRTFQRNIKAWRTLDGAPKGNYAGSTLACVDEGTFTVLVVLYVVLLEFRLSYSGI